MSSSKFGFDSTSTVFSKLSFSDSVAVCCCVSSVSTISTSTNDENSVWTKVTDVNQVFTQSVYIRVAEVVDVSPESYATFIEIK